jgi:hypothetical protein
MQHDNTQFQSVTRSDGESTRHRRDMSPDDGTAGKKPPASAVSRQPTTLLLRKNRDHVGIEAGNPDLGRPMMTGR